MCDNHYSEHLRQFCKAGVRQRSHRSCKSVPFHATVANATSCSILNSAADLPHEGGAWYATGAAAVTGTAAVAIGALATGCAGHPAGAIMAFGMPIAIGAAPRAFWSCA